jgi:hypothetical protein
MNNTIETTSTNVESTLDRRAVMALVDEGDAVSLSRDRMLSLRNAQDSRVHCFSGLLWVTEDKRVTDLVLKPGESFVIRHQGLVLVMALEDSRVSIKPEGLFDRIGQMIVRATGG